MFSVFNLVFFFFLKNSVLFLKNKTGQKKHGRYSRQNLLYVQYVRDCDPTICRENKLQRFLRSLKNQGLFTKDVYDNIYPCGSKPARIYGNPKTHKLKCKTDMLTFHHIVSSIGTYNYKLEKISWRTIESNYSITILCYRFLLFLQRNTRGKYI